MHIVLWAKEVMIHCLLLFYRLCLPILNHVKSGRLAEEALEKYLSVKKRKERIENMRIEKEASKQQDAINVIESEPELVEEEENQQDGAAAVSVVCHAGIDIACQTDTTVNDLHALEIDHQLRIQESVLTAKGIRSCT